MSFLASTRYSRKRAFCFLAPEYVHRKAWYAAMTRARPDVCYLVPKERYAFVASSGGRRENTAKPCRHWARDGRCPRGDECPFQHGGGGGSGASTSSEDAPVARGGGASSSVTGTRTVVAPFDCIWHVHAGEGRQRSVVAAWRQKYGGGDGKKEDALGARLVERAEDLPPPPPRLKRARAIETRE